MGKIIILNGSPRAPKSNSKRYAEIFARHSRSVTQYAHITKNNHRELVSKMSDFTDVLFVVPLYADALPVGFLNFLKTLEENPPRHKSVVSLLINCGFLEYRQNDIAVKMLQYFCRQNGYRMGSVLRLGSGEAILATPFKYVATRAIGRLARSIDSGRYASMQATMPLSRTLFRWASTYYWKLYGRRHGVTPEQMRTMQIE